MLAFVWCPLCTLEVEMGYPPSQQACSRVLLFLCGGGGAQSIRACSERPASFEVTSFSLVHSEIAGCRAQLTLFSEGRCPELSVRDAEVELTPPVFLFITSPSVQNPRAG